MPTLEELLSTTRHRLLGVGSYTDRVTELTADLDEGSAQIQVDEVIGQGREIIEIGLEKIRLKSADTATNTLTAYSFGRGYDGSLQSTHSNGSEVVYSPMIPAITLAREINSVLTNLYPTLYAVRTLDAVYTHSLATPFVLPDEAVDVVAVFREEIAGDGWTRVDEWRFEPDSGQGFIAAVKPGRNIRVVYATRIGLFDLTDPNVVDADFAETTGLESRVAEIITLGVAARLASYYDFGKLGATGAESRMDGAGKAAGVGIQVGNRLFQEYTMALEQEALVLYKQHPIRLHRERLGYRWSW